MTIKEKLLEAVKDNEYYELDKLFDEILKKKSIKDVCKKELFRLLSAIHRLLF